MDNQHIQVIVATHKKYQMPADPMYLPLHVGAEGKDLELGYTKDNTGDHISALNASFCELTGMYWAWKNLEADYVGLVHYRRHFSTAHRIPRTEDKKFGVLLTGTQASSLLSQHDIILPARRKYYIETLYDHYKHTMYIEPLDEAGKIIAEHCPDYLPEFEKLHQRTSAHMFNMFIMKREHFDHYCAWLFDILFELHKRIDPAQYDSFHARYLGRISELLLDVWINTNGLSYTEIPLIDMQNINWLKKGTSFLAAKFTGKKYGKSF